MPFVAITTPVVLASALAPLQMQETKLVAFGTCHVWLLLLNDHFRLLQWVH